jgi:aryl-alcohol dehydrogenase-like predicted oxidoreductase
LAHPACTSPPLSFGAGTFGGRSPLFGAGGDTGAREARRLIDICLDAGVTLFDTADVYSDGASEEVLGAAIKGRRHRLLLLTKTSLPTGEGPNDAGSSRARLIRAADAALLRLGTDYIDLLQLHAFDAGTPVEEVLSTLDDLIRAVGRAVPQIAIAWLLARPTVSSVIIGARNEEQLRANLGAVGWPLAPEHVQRLDAASEVTAPYPYFPYFRQEGFARLSPPAMA